MQLQTIAVLTGHQTVVGILAIKRAGARGASTDEDIGQSVVAGVVLSNVLLSPTMVAAVFKEVVFRTGIALG